ncbi:MAG: T9SS type A sorting domain-containing protein [Bacteroidia bacterium]
MKKVIFYSSLVWLLNFSNLKAQCNFNIDSLISDKTQLDYGNKVIQDNYGNYIICGNARDNSGSNDVGYLVKATSQGDTIWRKKFDFTLYTDIFRDIKEMPNKSYIILGTTTSTLGVNHVFLTNIDTNGVLLWYKQFAYPENDFASQIQITSDNKLVILGYTKSYTQSTGDILLIKTDLSGNLIWRKIIGSSSLDENYTSLQIINNNTNYLIGGTERPSSRYNFAVTKLDTAGNIIWNKLNASIGSVNFYGNTVCQTLDKGYLVGGKANTQGYIWKLDSTGTIQWSNAYGLNTFTIIKEVMQLPDSNLVYITNDNYLHSSSNIIKAGILAKIDKNGNLLWEKFYKRPSVGQQVVGINGFNFTKDNGYIITGSVVNTFGAPYTNLWLIKTDSLGNDSSNCAIYNSVKEITISNLAFEIYPNPTNSILNIIDKQNQFQNAIIEIKNYFGQVVFTCPFTNQINISQLTKGMYFILIKLKHTNRIIKFIKE